jgi:molybdopterin molybdotransferase
MVSVAEAEKIILSQLFKPAQKLIPLSESIGKILAEQILADRDLPPFHRATMDGIAIAFSESQQDFFVEGICAAGQPQQRLSDPRNCFEIMTGAPLPIGTDTVIPYEQIKIENKVAKIQAAELMKGLNVHWQGSDAKKNEMLLTPPLKISPAEISLLASVGKSEVMVYEHPRIALLSTGDELVDINQIPLPHQIRKSNTFALQAALRQLGFESFLFHVSDQEQKVNDQLSELISQFEIIILSGGVSKGKFDFVPQVLDSLGIKKLFHTISQRPGKPMWFGRSEKNFVFALPGNPVSTFMCFYRYVKPWLEKSLGQENNFREAILAEDFKFAPALTYFLQVKVKNENGMLKAFPIMGGGSGDFANLKEVDGFLELPLNQNDFKSGSVYSFYKFRLD